LIWQVGIFGLLKENIRVLTVQYLTHLDYHSKAWFCCKKGMQIIKTDDHHHDKSYT